MSIADAETKKRRIFQKVGKGVSVYGTFLEVKSQYLSQVQSSSSSSSSFLSSLTLQSVQGLLYFINFLKHNYSLKEDCKSYGFCHNLVIYCIYIYICVCACMHMHYSKQQRNKKSVLKSVLGFLPGAKRQKLK